jgi:RNA polymerase sigma-70 factor, ECF subfamily
MTDSRQLDWNYIVDTHAKRVFRLARRILGSTQDAEDVSQEVFMEAFKLYNNGGVKSWVGLLVRLATLRSLDRLRKWRENVTVTESDRVSYIEPVDVMMAQELSQWVRNAVSRLRDNEAAVFVMHYFEELSREEISAALSISPDAVSTALCKARKHLLSQMAIANGGASQ